MENRTYRENGDR